MLVPVQLYKNFKADCLKGSRMKFGPAQKFEKPVLSSHEYGWVKPAVQKTPRERGEDPNFHPLNSSAITKVCIATSHCIVYTILALVIM